MPGMRGQGPVAVAAAVAAAAVLLAAAGVAACGEAGPSAGEDGGAGSSGAGGRDAAASRASAQQRGLPVETRRFGRPGHPADDSVFAAAYWRRPVPLQGPAPEGWTALEASLRPADCGRCHPAKYRDWRTSLHAGVYSPGLSGQLAEIRQHSPRTARRPSRAADAPRRTGRGPGLRVTNTGAGHRFPTYAPPEVVVRVEASDATGRVLPGGVARDTITRRLRRKNDRWVELEDTRLRPDSSLTVRLDALPDGAAQLRGVVRVRPDAFYRRLFRRMLDGDLSGPARRRLEEAHRRTRESPFMVFDDTVRLR